MSPIVVISGTPGNVHSPARNASGTDTQFAEKWTPKNYLMYHFKPGRVRRVRRGADIAVRGSPGAFLPGARVPRAGLGGVSGGQKWPEYRFAGEIS